MARPERKTVDYFPHYISDGKKMFYIEQKYGNDGYASWFKILESLASTDDHFLNLNSQMDLLFLSAKCRVDDAKLLAILNDLSMLGEIDEFLWMNKIVYSHKFVESIQDAYTRRTNKCMDYDSFCIHYRGLCTTITLEKYRNSNRNPQSKVKETKLKETKEEEKETKEILFDQFWKLYDKKVGRKEVQKKWMRFDLETMQTIITKVPDYVKATPDSSYRKNPMTYLNGQHWEDEIILKPLNNFNNGTTTQPRRTLDDQVNDLTARVLGINTEQSSGTTSSGNGIEEADCSVLE